MATISTLKFLINWMNGCIVLIQKKVNMATISPLKYLLIKLKSQDGHHFNIEGFD
jgi:hypothetical protein